MNADLRDAWKQVAVGAVRAGRRLALGTGLLLHSIGQALSPGGCGALLVRGVMAVVGLAFYGALLRRAPQLIGVLPVVWLWAAWQLSDSSATPPPVAAAPLRDVSADEAARAARVATDPNGVMCIMHAPREGVNSE